MGRTRVGNGGIANVVKDIVKSIEAGFWHTHDVGSEEHIVGKLTDIVGPEASVGEIEHVFTTCA